MTSAWTSRPRRERLPGRDVRGVAEPALLARELEARVSLPVRTGIVLDRHGGAWPRCCRRFAPASADPVAVEAGSTCPGSRRRPQKKSLRWCSRRWMTPATRGPVNASAPRPVTNAEFSPAALGRVLHRPSVMPVPDGRAARCSTARWGRSSPRASERVSRRALARASPSSTPELDGAASARGGRRRERGQAGAAGAAGRERRGAERGAVDAASWVANRATPCARVLWRRCQSTVTTARAESCADQTRSRHKRAKLAPTETEPFQDPTAASGHRTTAAPYRASRHKRARHG